MIKFHCVAEDKYAKLLQNSSPPGTVQNQDRAEPVEDPPGNPPKPEEPRDQPHSAEDNPPHSEENGKTGDSIVSVWKNSQEEKESSESTKETEDKPLVSTFSPISSDDESEDQETVDTFTTIVDRWVFLQE